MSWMFSERCSSHASATAIGVASRRAATDFGDHDAPVGTDPLG
jgi:hypothetical protein